jgi:hypothetical protein
LLLKILITLSFKPKLNIIAKAVTIIITLTFD